MTDRIQERFAMAAEMVQELPRAANGAMDGNLDKLDRRERCQRCGQRNPIGFHVPDAIWQRVHDLTQKSDRAWPTLGGSPPDVPDRYDILDILCINCFTTMADWFGVEWDHVIELTPISKYTSVMVDRASDREPCP